MKAPAPLLAWAPRHLPGVGCIGETEPDRIREAETWLAHQGCSIARGPLMGATWYPYRAVLGPHARPLFLGEPGFAPEPWQDLGYRVAATYSSSLVPGDVMIPKGAAVAQQRLAEGWTIRDFASIGLDTGLPLLHHLAHQAFRDAFAFTPLDLEAFEAIYRPIAELYVPELVFVVFDPDGTPAGFCFSIPDLLNPERGELVVKTIAVDPAFHRRGLGNWLTGEAQARARAMGLSGDGIHALMSEGNHSTAFGGAHSTLIRRYALFERELGP